MAVAGRSRSSFNRSRTSGVPPFTNQRARYFIDSLPYSPPPLMQWNMSYCAMMLSTVPTVSMTSSSETVSTDARLKEGAADAVGIERYASTAREKV